MASLTLIGSGSASAEAQRHDVGRHQKRGRVSARTGVGDMVGNV
jgi:hypothetical protein